MDGERLCGHIKYITQITSICSLESTSVSEKKKNGSAKENP